MDYLLASLAVFAAPADLGHPDWHRREASCGELRSRLWTQPLVWAAAVGDDPEARDRAWRLLLPTRELIADARAWAVVADPWPPSPDRFWADHSLRRRVLRQATAAGWVWRGAYYWADPPADPDPFAADDAAPALADLRRFFGYAGPGWPFPK